ncbi:flavin reductase family protein [Marinactinospora rubrisoli]|uniref:Flavin reductase family protein n=1 Tax=Marinactinospora rubrisoli TaxID=2715399 RepID=A0ABW2KAH1_9ACTN
MTGRTTGAPAPPASLDTAAFRAAAGGFATGVAVLAASDGEHSFAKTVSSFTSVSLEPPLISVAVDSRSPIVAVICASGGFAVSVLHAGQRHLAERFAAPGQGQSRGRFAAVATSPGRSGAPLLDDALSRFDCALHHRLPGGDHTILLGRVLETAHAPGAPLIYHRGRLHGTAPCALAVKPPPEPDRRRSEPPHERP